MIFLVFSLELLPYNKLFFYHIHLISHYSIYLNSYIIVVEAKSDPSNHNAISSDFKFPAAYPIKSLREVPVTIIGIATETADIVCIDFNISLATDEF